MSGMHEYITIGARRWCLRCNTFQRRRNGVWLDDEELLGAAWPAYEKTELSCLGALDLFSLRAD